MILDGPNPYLGLPKRSWLSPPDWTQIASDIVDAYNDAGPYPSPTAWERLSTALTTAEMAVMQLGVPANAVGVLAALAAETLDMPALHSPDLSEPAKGTARAAVNLASMMLARIDCPAGALARGAQSRSATVCAAVLANDGCPMPLRQTALVRLHELGAVTIEPSDGEPSL